MSKKEDNEGTLKGRRAAQGGSRTADFASRKSGRNNNEKNEKGRKPRTTRMNHTVSLF